jgi:hypothetical protein
MRKGSRHSKKGKRAASGPQNEALVEHRQFGVWDLYVERDPKLSYIPTSWGVEKYAGLLNDLPYFWRTVRDVGTMAWPLLALYVVITLIKSLIPALNLWYVGYTFEKLDNSQFSRLSGQLVNIVSADGHLRVPLTRNLVVSQVQVAVDKRAVDTDHLIRIAGGRVLCAAIGQILDSALWRVSGALNGRIRRFYSTHIFHSVARLDVPTWDDPVVSAQIEAVIPKGSNSIAWAAITSIVQTGSTFVRLFSQTAVLMGVLWDQRDGLFLSLLTFASDAFTFFNLTLGGDIGVGGG